jgi:hypothetical protein
MSGLKILNRSNARAVIEGAFAGNRTPMFVDVSSLLKRGGDLPEHILDIIEGNVAVHLLDEYDIQEVDDVTDHEAKATIAYLATTGTVTKGSNKAQAICDFLAEIRGEDGKA